MLRQYLTGLALLLTLARPLAAASIWAAWDLDLLPGDVPPTAFVLTVTSTSIAPAPLPLTVPATPCTAVPEARYCTQLGCPPDGAYTFSVQAQYAAGLSEASNTWRCTAVNAVCACEEGEPVASPLVPRPAPVARFCQRQSSTSGITPGPAVALSSPRLGGG